MIKSILFLCVANSARSQMAEAITRNLFDKEYIIQSAGSNPSFVHPLSIKALSEINISIKEAKSKSVNEIDLSKVDLIITLCAEEVCPIVNTDVKKLHWPLNDPAKPTDDKDQIEVFREVRTQIKYHLENLKKELENK